MMLICVFWLIPGCYLFRLRKVVHSALEKLFQVAYTIVYQWYLPLYHMLVHVFGIIHCDIRFDPF